MPWLSYAETKTASLLARPAAPGCRTRYTQMQNSKPRQTEFLQKIVTLIYCDLVAGSLLEKNNLKIVKLLCCVPDKMK